MCFKQAVGSDVNWVGHHRRTFYSLVEITAAGPRQRRGKFQLLDKMTVGMM